MSVVLMHRSRAGWIAHSLDRVFSCFLCVQEGDFHDVLYIPAIPGKGAMEASIRVQPGPFTGYSVFHCQ